MIISNVISRAGVAMAYYGAFGSIPCIFAKKSSNEAIFLSAVVLSIGIAYVIKKSLHITFQGPERKPRP